VKELLWALLVLATVASPAAAASNVTQKFDGVYAGSAQPATSVGTPDCSSFALAEVTIAGGFFKAPQNVDAPIITGFITEEGYVAAYLGRPGHQRAAMDGRFDNGEIVAGFIEPDSGCAWVVHLALRP